MRYAIITACLIIFGFLSVSQISAQIRINEFSSAGSSDWIELYNESEEEVNLAGFVLEDNKAHKKDLEGQIAAKGFIVISWSNLNQDVDSVILVDTDGNTEEIKYGTDSLRAPLTGQSAGRTIDGAGEWVIFTNPSEGSSNIGGTVFQTPTPTPTHAPTPTKTPTPTNMPTPNKEPTATKIPTVTKSMPTKTLITTQESEEKTSSEPALLGTSDINESSRIIGKEKNENDSEVKTLGATDSSVSGFAMIGGSVLLLSACGILLWRKYKYGFSP